MNHLIKHIESKNLELFILEWNESKTKLTEKDKQDLLTEILSDNYDRNYFSFYKKVFDIIINSQVDLNFNINHWAPTFLSLVVLVSPTKQLFEYFLKKGADINFIGDCYAFEDEKTIKKETEELNIKRYSTCLDFGRLKIADLFTVNYNFSPPNLEELKMSYRDLNPKKKIEISETEYHYLLEQSEYLWNLVNTDNLLDYIKNSGGKTYEELKRK